MTTPTTPTTPTPTRPTTPTPRLSPWAPLRHTVFAALFAAQLASNIGTFFQSVAAAWLMGDLTSSPTLVALIPTAALAPILLVGVPAGALADIFDRRRLLIAMQLWMVVCATLLAVVTLLDAITPVSLLALTFALGTGSALMSPAWQAIQPDLVPPGEFPQAVALSSLTFNAGRAIGPALGGVLIATAGAGWAFAVNAASFIGVVGVLLWWRPGRNDRADVESVSGAVRAGLRFGVNSPALRAVLVRTAAFAAPAAALQALLPEVVRDRLGMGSGVYGIMLGVFGVGAITAAILRPRLDVRLSPDRSLTASTLAVLVTLVAVGVVRSPFVLAPVLLVAGAAWTTATVTLNVVATQVLPWWVRARGLALYMLVLAGGIAVGSATWGALASISLTVAFFGAAVAMGIGALSAVRWKLSEGRGLDLQPAPLSEPTVVLKPEPTDGPVLVTVVYRVPQEHHEAYVTAMERVELERRRGGAHEWWLYRDLVDTNKFVEMFQVATWAEHMRQHHRRTVRSDVLHSRAREFATSEIVSAHLLSAYSTGGLRRPEAQAGVVVPVSGTTVAALVESSTTSDRVPSSTVRSPPPSS